MLFIVNCKNDITYNLNCTITYNCEVIRSEAFSYSVYFVLLFGRMSTVLYAIYNSVSSFKMVVYLTNSESQSRRFEELDVQSFMIGESVT